MLKFSKLIGVFNLVFTFVMIASLTSFMFDDTPSAGLALALASISLLIVSFILTIPFVIILKTKGYGENKFYVWTHISLLSSSAIALVISNMMS